MLWLDVLKNWENGIVLKYPNELCDKFQWNTSVLHLCTFKTPNCLSFLFYFLNIIKN